MLGLGSRGARRFVDADGRERIFHGVNAVVKGPPWRPATDSYDYRTSLVDEDFELLASAGVTVIRLGVMWAGVEPTRGVYDAAYVDAMVALARRAADYGIYTLLDMHQDVMSEKFCGEGLPAWAVQPRDALPFPQPVSLSPYPDDPTTGMPSARNCEKHAWSQFYFSAATSSAFQALYENHDGLLDAWAAMWAHVAGAFRGAPHVLGAELINEPWPGDVVAHPTLLIPTEADRKLLQPAYDTLAAAIWVADPDRLVFFAGVTWDDRGSGFERAPGGGGGGRADAGQHAVYSYHYYEFPSGPQLANSSTYHITTQTGDAARLGTGAMLTEFGEYGFMDERGVFQAVTDSADAALQSWAMWEYKTFCISPVDPAAQNGRFGACKTGYGGKLFDSSGAVMKERLRGLARTYAPAVGGRALLMRFSDASADFDLEFVPAPACPPDAPPLPTRIYLNEALNYPGGYSVALSPPGAAAWARVGPNELAVTPSAAAAAAGTLVHVTIRRAAS